MSGVVRHEVGRGWQNGPGRLLSVAKAAIAGGKENAAGLQTRPTEGRRGSPPPAVRDWLRCVASVFERFAELTERDGACGPGRMKAVPLEGDQSCRLP